MSILTDRLLGKVREREDIEGGSENFKTPERGALKICILQNQQERAPLKIEPLMRGAAKVSISSSHLVILNELSLRSFMQGCQCVMKWSKAGLTVGKEIVIIEIPVKLVINYSSKYLSNSRNNWDWLVFNILYFDLFENCQGWCQNNGCYFKLLDSKLSNSVAFSVSSFSSNFQTSLELQHLKEKVVFLVIR